MNAIRNVWWIALAAVWLVACNGGQSSPGSPPDSSAGGSPPPPVNPANSVCATVPAPQLVCPGAGAICVGFVTPTTIHSVTELTQGNRPDWSPDGSRIAFHRLKSSASLNGGIHIINVDGSGEVELATGAEPTWSPDGNRIAFASASGISVINANGSGLTTLLERRAGSNETLRAPAWSPDGGRIAYLNSADAASTQPRLYVMNADGSDARRVTPGTAAQLTEGHPSWSPDAGRIVFSYGGIATIDAGGGQPQIIVPGESHSNPDWSADGTTIAFQSVTTCGPDNVSIVNADGSAHRSLIVGAREPSWSADASRIAFVSGKLAFPPAPVGAVVYERESPTTYGALERYVLGEFGTFTLDSLSRREEYFSWAGSYLRDGDVIRFEFDGGRPAFPWVATGTLDGIRLSVAYNATMQLTDFEDGVFFLISDAAPGP